MSSAAYNLLWIPPKFPDQSEHDGGKIIQPIPGNTVENLRHIADINSGADVRLWVDSARTTDQQMEWLRNVANESPAHNLSLLDLRTIPEYRENPFFNQPDESSEWRTNKHSLIWRQVDVAKILICLQGDYDQSFFSDADVTNFNISSDEVRGKLAKYGIMLGGYINDRGFSMFENQLFGFNRSKRNLFNLLYIRTLKNVREKKENGWPTLIDFINQELRTKEGMVMEDLIFECRYDGSEASHFDQEGRI